MGGRDAEHHTRIPIPLHPHLPPEMNLMEASKTAAEHRTFEQSLLALQQIIRKLEDGDTSLEESLASYEQGVGLLKHCYGQLREAEQRILMLTGVDKDGNPVTQPFEHSATVAGGESPRRRRKEKPEIPF